MNIIEIAGANLRSQEFVQDVVDVMEGTEGPAVAQAGVAGPTGRAWALQGQAVGLEGPLVGQRGSAYRDLEARVIVQRKKLH